MEIDVESVLVGAVMRLTDDGETSAIGKLAVADSRRVDWLGIAGDAQADRTVHGGRDKAIHHYPRDHYDWWRARLPNRPLLAQAGAFGENISTTGLTEETACIGDRYRLGTALVEIAQGRQPCWKQAHRLGDNGVVAAMVTSRCCGWYYRVIEQGAVAGGDTLVLIERPHPEWTVARVIGSLIAGGGKSERLAMRDLARLDVLAAGWRAKAARLAG